MKGSHAGMATPRISSKLQFRHIFAFYAVVNFLYFALAKVPFVSDSQYYFELAQTCLQQGTLYPAAHNLYDSFIIAPPYINLLLLLLKIYNSPSTIVLFNVVLNLTQLVLFHQISGRLFENARYAVIAALLYILYLTNLGAVLLNLTDLFFSVLILGSYYLYLRNDAKHHLLSGLLMGAAICIRQFGWALLFSLLVCYLFELRPGRGRHIKLGLISTACFVAVLGFGFFVKHNFGHFVYTSTHGAHTILMGGNEFATGTHSARSFEPGARGFIENAEKMTFSEKRTYWQSQAFDWITSHPMQWLALVPKKLFYTFIWDDWSLPGLLNTSEWNAFVVLKMVVKEGRLSEVFEGRSFVFKVAFVTVHLFHHAYYFILLASMLCQFRAYGNTQWRTKFMPIYLFAAFSLCITMLGVGSARYKYPYFLMMIFTLVPMLNYYIERKTLLLRRPENTASTAVGS